MVIRPPDHARLTEQRERPPQDAVRESRAVVAGPQDASWSPQDAAAAAEHHAPTVAAPTPCLAALGLTVAIAAVVWQQVSASLRASAATRVAATAATLPGHSTTTPVGPSPQWVATLHESIIDRVPRPNEGPACFGGRDSTAYLRGWDDAVDWVGKAHDAKPPTWGDVAYMTGWSEAVRAIDRARRSAIG